MNTKNFKHTDIDHHNHLIETMRNFFDDEPQVGIFWYDIHSNQLFGVEKDDAAKYIQKNGDGTLPKLHRSYWKKQHYRAISRNNVDSIFYKEDNYTLIPRGIVFVKSNGDLFVTVGDWIYNANINIEDLRDLIADTFNLPDNFEIVIDEHWNIGNGWNEDNF